MMTFELTDEQRESWVELSYSYPVTAREKRLGEALQQQLAMRRKAEFQLHHKNCRHPGFGPIIPTAPRWECRSQQHNWTDDQWRAAALKELEE